MTSLNDLGSCSANTTGIAVRLPSLRVNLFLRSNMLRRRPVVVLAVLLSALVVVLLSLVCSITRCEASHCPAPLLTCHRALVEHSHAHFTEQTQQHHATRDHCTSLLYILH